MGWSREGGGIEEGGGGPGLHTATGFIAAAPHLLITISSRVPCVQHSQIYPTKLYISEREIYCDLKSSADTIGKILFGFSRSSSHNLMRYVQGQLVSP